MAIKGRKHNQLVIFLIITFFTTALVSALFLVSSTKSRLQTVTINDEVFLTHGEDKLEDFAQNFNGTRILAEGGPTAFCEGDGKDGPRVQVIYAAPKGTNRYNEMLSTIRILANEASDTIDTSAKKTGGRRIIRFVTEPGCLLDVANMKVSNERMATAGNVIYAAKQQGFQKPNRKYMIFVELPGFCGMSTLVDDDRPAPNSKHSENSYGVLGIDCFNSGAFVHELMHGLGAVQKSAPNATSGMHCVDDHDRMCRKDADDVILRLDCPNLADEPLLDCNDNDYFNTNPAPGSYLATHWNAANSFFLDDPMIKEEIPTTAPTKKPKKNKKENKNEKKQNNKKGKSKNR